MTFAIWFVLLEVAIIAQGVCAWKTKFFTRNQGKKYGTASEKFLPFVEHGGMYGDFIIVSPMIAWIIVSFATLWHLEAIILVGIGVTLVGLIPVLLWAKESVKEPAVWNKGGKVSLAGWIHLVYMSVATTVFVLFYFFTPIELISSLAAKNISVLLIVHVLLGFGQTEYVTQKRIRLRAGLTVFVLWILILAGWFRLVTA